MGYEYPYTNSDVRGDKNLYQLAVHYAEGYTGEFEPLVNARNMLMEGIDLPTQVARVVLNCMRYDRDICDTLPAPARRLQLVESPSPRKRDRKIEERLCENTSSHSSHWTTETCTRCPGVPWKINRPDRLIIDARVKMPFAVARSGSLVHRTDGTGKFFWLPKAHEWGFTWRPELHVKLICRYPSVLRDPVLLSEEPDYNMAANAIRPLGRCIRGCFE